MPKIRHNDKIQNEFGLGDLVIYHMNNAMIEQHVTMGIVVQVTPTRVQVEPVYDLMKRSERPWHELDYQKWWVKPRNLIAMHESTYSRYIEAKLRNDE